MAVIDWGVPTILGINYENGAIVGTDISNIVEYSNVVYDSTISGRADFSGGVYDIEKYLHITINGNTVAIPVKQGIEGRTFLDCLRISETNNHDLQIEIKDTHEISQPSNVIKEQLR